MNNISDQLTHSTIRIECKTNSGTCSGTGFFFNFLVSEDKKSGVLCIVTNKHVINDAIDGTLIVSCKINNATYHETIHVSDFKQAWLFHPDPNIDLCIMPFLPIMESLAKQGKQPSIVWFDKSLIPTKEQIDNLTAIEDIIMIGYPDGIWDSINNKPIFRKGITATHPKYNFNGKKEFLIDAACFPGSSGSPVIIFNQGSYTNGNGIAIGNRLYFMGIMYAGPQHTAIGNIRFATPTTHTKIPNNLGVVIKAEQLLTFENILEKIVNR